MGRTAVERRMPGAVRLGAALVALAWLASASACAEAAAAPLFLRGYVEMLGIGPTLALLAALAFTVRIDPYIRRQDRRTMLLISVLVFCLVAQNYVEYRLAMSAPKIVARTLVSSLGYSVRPAILVLFFHIVRPQGRYRWAWLAVGANALLYLTSLFTHLCFWISEDNHYVCGPLSETCLVVSAALIACLLYMTLRAFHPAQRREAWIPVFVLLLIVLSVALDYSVGDENQPISYLTVAVAISCAFYYIWLHLQFVREHEQALQAEQRILIMISQIQPHFLYNTLSTIQALCREDPQRAERVVKRFGTYLRQNIDSLNRSSLIPFEREIEHTKVYAEIEVERFPNIRMVYDIRDEGFFVPALTVQPLVENAIRHGVRIREDGEVRVESFREDGGHVIVIRDNGKGFDSALALGDGQHIGIQNVCERVEQLCGGRVTIDSKPGDGTVVTVRIPMETDKAQREARGVGAGVNRR